jgi:hypothetical protein
VDTVDNPHAAPHMGGTRLASPIPKADYGARYSFTCGRFLDNFSTTFGGLLFTCQVFSIFWLLQKTPPIYGGDYFPGHKAFGLKI